MPRISGVELGQSRGWYPLQHLLREDPQQLPPDIERLENSSEEIEMNEPDPIDTDNLFVSPVIVISLSDEVLLKLA